MALATRCPACHTAFRVVTDQLKLHQGLVRCGQCGHVFNGLQHLLDDEAARTPVPNTANPSLDAPKLPPSTSSEPLETSSMARQRHLQAPALLPELVEDAPSFLAPPQATAHGTAETTQQAEPASAADTEVTITSEAGLIPLTLSEKTDTAAPAEAIVSEAIPGTATEAGIEQVATDETPTNHQLAPVNTATAAATARSDTEPSAPVEALSEVSFLKAATARHKALRSPWRWWWRGLFLIFVALTAVQGAWLLRGPLSLQFPPLEPFFKEVCATIDCTWKPPQQIDALQIEHSSLQKSEAGSHSYALSVTLRNKADISIAMPALELSLTDFQGQLLARKVFLPQEYLGKATGNLLLQGLSPQNEVPLRLQLELSQAALNYRVLIFYP